MKWDIGRDRGGEKCCAYGVVDPLLRRVVGLSNSLNTQYVQCSELQHHNVDGLAYLTIWISSHFQLWLPPNTIYHTSTRRYSWGHPQLRECNTREPPWYGSLFIGFLPPNLVNQRGLTTITTSLVCRLFCQWWKFWTHILFIGIPIYPGTHQRLPPIN